MPIDLISEHLNGLKVLKPKVFGDERGFFLESYKESELKKYGISEKFLQDNHSSSTKDVLRGLHFQWDKPMGKLIRVTRGSALVCEVDIRKDSPTYKQYFMIEISSKNFLMLWVPFGFANGFLTLEDNTEMQYKCTAEWNPKAESAIKWDDKSLNINWGIEKPILSGKDSFAESLNDWENKKESDLITFRKRNI